jgi:hypothetical protein
MGLAAALLLFAGGAGCASTSQAKHAAVFTRTSEVAQRPLLGLVYELDGVVVHRTDARDAQAGGGRRRVALPVAPGVHRLAVGLEYGGAAREIDLDQGHVIACRQDGRLDVRVRAFGREQGTKIELETSLAGDGCALASR